jgi:integrase
MDAATFGSLGTIKDLRTWANQIGIGKDLDVVLDVTMLAERPDAAGNLIALLCEPYARVLLQRWAETSPAGLCLSNISGALQNAPEIQNVFPPIMAYGHAHKHFPRCLDEFYLAALLIVQRPPKEVADERVRSGFSLLRLWVLHRAVSVFLENGYRHEVSLTGLSHRLRIASDESRKRELAVLRVFDYSNAHLRRPDQLDRHFIGEAEKAAASTDDTKARELLSWVAAIVRDAPRAVSIRSNEIPTLLSRQRTEQKEVLNESDEFAGVTPPEEIDSDEDELKVVASDGEKEDTVVMSACKPSYVFSHLNNRAKLLMSAEAVHFLPGSWTSLTTYEQDAVTAIARQLTSSDRQDQQLLGVILEIALRCGRSLRLTLEVEFSEGTSGEWWIDRAQGVLCRRSPRRHSRWKPGEEDVAWVVQAVDRQELTLSEGSDRVIRSMSPINDRAYCLGDLWQQVGTDSPETRLYEALRDLCPRITPGMLASVLGSQIQKNERDSTLTRLATSHPRSELPGACAYATFPTSRIGQAFAAAIPELSGQPTRIYDEDRNDSGAGSLLSVVEHLLPTTFGKAADTVQALIDSALDGQYDAEVIISAHNAYVAYIVVLLLAATGARPVLDPFESADDFDWKYARVYVDDKSHGDHPFGRLIPVPRALLDHVREKYAAHLDALATSLQNSAPLLASSIRALSKFDTPGDMPFFFGLRTSAGKIDWVSVSESFIGDTGIFDWPLPLNFLRHRLANRLRTSNIDPEVIDGLLGHAEYGAESYSDQSFRCWLSDMAKAVPALDEYFAALKAPLISGLPSPAQIEPSSVVYEARDRPRLYGRQARAERRQIRLADTRKRARDLVRRSLAGKHPSKLTPLEITRIGDELLFQSDCSKPASISEESDSHEERTVRRRQIPTERGWAAYQHFLSVIDRYGRRYGIALAPTRYLERRNARSLFSDRSPQSQELFERFRSAARNLGRYIGQISRANAALRGALLLMAEARLCDQAILKDVLKRKNYRIGRIGHHTFFEYSPEMHATDIDVAVKRLPISTTAANLLHRATVGKPEAYAEAYSLSGVVGEIAELAVGIESGAISDTNSLVSFFAQIVDQANVIELPGIVAGLLAGRVTSYAPSARLDIQLTSGIPRDFPNAADSAEGEPDAPEFEISLRPRTDATVLQADRALLRAIRTMLRKYKDSERKAKADRKASLPDSAREPPASRRDLMVALRREISQHAESTSPSVTLLVGWIASQVTRKSAKRYVAIGTLLRYLGALAPGFVEAGTGVDPRVSDMDELTEFYRAVLLLGKHERPEYRQDRLRCFHRWLVRHYGVSEPDWSELPFESSSHPASFSIITESDYFRVLTHLAPGDGASTIDQACAVLLMLCYRFGLRPNEAAYLLRTDVVEFRDAMFVIVQTNTLRRTKTPKGSARVVPLLFELSADERVLWERWQQHLNSSAAVAEKSPVFSDESGSLIDAARLYHAINRALKSATGNPFANLYNARHTAANAVLVALANQNINAASGIPGAKDDDQHRKIQELLLGYPGCSRRSNWAIARYLGHTNVERSQISYLHFLWDWAGCFWKPLGRSSRIDPTIADRGVLPKASISLQGKPRIEACPPAILSALKYLVLRSKGFDGPSAVKGMCLEAHAGVRWTQFLNEVDRRLHLPGVPRDPSNQESARVLDLIRPAAWKKMQSYAHDALEKETAFENIKAIDNMSECLVEMVGNSRQLVGWRDEHFRIIRCASDYWGIGQENILVVPTRIAFADKAFDELVARYSFSLTSPATARKKRTQIDYVRSANVTIDGRAPHEYRVAFLLNSTDQCAVRSATELLIAVVVLGMAMSSTRLANEVRSAEGVDDRLGAIEERLRRLECLKR